MTSYSFKALVDDGGLLAQATVTTHREAEAFCPNGRSVPKERTSADNVISLSTFKREQEIRGKRNELA